MLNLSLWCDGRRRCRVPGFWAEALGGCGLVFRGLVVRGYIVNPYRDSSESVKVPL